MKYFIKETQSFNSGRGVEIEATSLRAAKLMASKNRCFYGTDLKIYNDNGVLLSYKFGTTKRWQDC